MLIGPNPFSICSATGLLCIVVRAKRRFRCVMAIFVNLVDVVNVNTLEDASQKNRQPVSLSAILRRRRSNSQIPSALDAYDDRVAGHKG
jgi:hypothetical protein